MYFLKPLNTRPKSAVSCHWNTPMGYRAIWAFVTESVTTCFQYVQFNGYRSRLGQNLVAAFKTLPRSLIIAALAHAAHQQQR